MSTTLLGKKLGTTQIFDDSGNCIPVTVIEAGPCVVVQKMTPAKNKYSALQLGFEEISAHKLNKPDSGTFQKRDLKPMRHLREVRLPVEEVEKYNVGDKLTVSIFEAVKKVDVTSVSKGCGFQGVMKRFHFQGFPKTRGTHEYRRHPGSIGMREWPGKVMKGKKLPGHMGAERVTVQSIKLVKVDLERNLLMIKGSVPGPRGAFVVVQKAVKS